VYGVCAVTAVTRRTGTHDGRAAASSRIVSEQMDAVLGEMRVTRENGMLWSEGIVKAVWRGLLNIGSRIW